jgi:hypothetical protein
MTLELDCDTCAYTRELEEEWRAYDEARKHEAENPTHAVLLRRLP